MRQLGEIEQFFAPRERLEGLSHLFLVGIGGAGLSGLAEAGIHLGLKIYGSDGTESPTLDHLRKAGATVRLGHSKDIPGPVQAVVLSDAIDIAINPEAQAAIQKGLPLFRRSQLLGHLVSKKRVIAVTGTHGKTTTSGMVAWALEAAGADPFAIIGAPLVGWDSPVRMGNGDWAVVEACEAYNGMLDIDPEIVVLTNLEMDHEDFHITYERLEGSIVQFLDKVGPTGKVVYCASDKGAADAAKKSISPTEGYRRIDGIGPLSVPGDHNLLNASGALQAALLAVGEENREKAIEGLRAFRGAKRRLELLHDEAIAVYDDYAHAPTEIEASLEALRDRHPDRRLVVVYQPHLYSRTHRHESAFAAALDHADCAFVTDIYPAREDPIPGTSSAVIVERMKIPTMYVPSRHLLPREVSKGTRGGDVVVGMGAGSIESFAPAFIQELGRRPRSAAAPLRVAVAYGGDSSEREVSLLSGRACERALQAMNIDAYLIDFSELLLTGKSLDMLIGPKRPDLVYLAVHGRRAEDGAIQGLLDMLHIPYTGSGILASALAMDKAKSKQVLEAAGIRTPQGQLVTDPNTELTIPLPVVVKPNAEGSTIGLSFVRKPEEFRPALERALAYGESALVEEEIVGMEVSTPVLGDEALLPVEIAPKSGVYDFSSKYEVGGAEEIVPARLPEHLLRQCQETAVRAHQALGCSGASRTDMIVRPQLSPDQAVVVLEVNTLPGMASTSLYPASAAGMGLSYADICLKIVMEAVERYGLESIG